MLYDEDTILL